MSVRDTSADAYHGMGPKLGQQQRQIIAHLAQHCHRDWTRGEIAQAIPMRLSSVCGRIKELSKLQMIQEGERRPCKTTGIAAHPIKLATVQLELGLAA